LKRTIKHTLRKIGLSEKETDVYIFISKKGTVTGTEITRQLKMNKGQTYRLLKSLQRKGAVETTLEYPIRFVPVPFEKIIDAYIKSKREEVDLIETSKKALLEDWKKISETEFASLLERFSIIEGKKKILHKIAQMIEVTSNKFLGALSVSDLLRADQYGAFDLLEKKSNIQFQVLTQSKEQHLEVLRALKARLKPVAELRGRNPSLGLPKFTRMAIRDKQEIILFISDSVDTKEVCLWTNCRSIIQSFYDVFEGLWQDSIDIEKLISQIDSGKSPTQTRLIKNPTLAKKNYNDLVKSAEKEVLIVTSSEGLNDLSKMEPQFEEWTKKGVTIKIMAPIVNENLANTQSLLKWCEIRHIPLGYFETIIIDGTHLFQFKQSISKVASSDEAKFRDTYYTNDYDYIQKTKNMLYELWRQAHKPSPYSIRTLPDSRFSPIKLDKHHELLKKTMVLQHAHNNQITATRNEVLDKIRQEKKLSSEENIHWNDTLRYFGSRAFSVINAPKMFSVPKMVIGVFRFDDSSSFGAHNMMAIDLWSETEDGGSFVPVALIQDIEKSLDLRKTIFNVIDEKNFRILKQNEFVVRMKGSTLFAGWTVPIPLETHNIIIPPCCLLFEGYGNIKSGSYVSSILSGRKHEFWYNSVDAFVTLYHPKSKYVGAGTEGFIDTESVLLSEPPLVE
jgi:sugar-specific transcriptional regulator TrmB